MHKGHILWNNAICWHKVIIFVNKINNISWSWCVITFLGGITIFAWVKKSDRPACHPNVTDYNPQKYIKRKYKNQNNKFFT